MKNYVSTYSSSQCTNVATWLNFPIVCHTQCLTSSVRIFVHNMDAKEMQKRMKLSSPLHRINSPQTMIFYSVHTAAPTETTSLVTSFFADGPCRWSCTSLTGRLSLDPVSQSTVIKCFSKVWTVAHCKCIEKLFEKLTKTTGLWQIPPHMMALCFPPRYLTCMALCLTPCYSTCRILVHEVFHVSVYRMM